MAHYCAWPKQTETRINAANMSQSTDVQVFQINIWHPVQGSPCLDQLCLSLSPIFVSHSVIQDSALLPGNPVEMP